MTRGVLIGLIGGAATTAAVVTGVVLTMQTSTPPPATSTPPASTSSPVVTETPAATTTSGDTLRACEPHELLDLSVDCLRGGSFLSALPACSGDAFDPGSTCLAADTPDAIGELIGADHVDITPAPQGYTLILPGRGSENIIPTEPSNLEVALANLQGDWELVDYQVQLQGPGISQRQYLQGGTLRISGNRWFYSEHSADWDIARCQADVAQRGAASSIGCELTCEVTGPQWMYGTLQTYQRNTSQQPYIGPMIAGFYVPTAARSQGKQQVACGTAGNAATLEGDAWNPLVLTFQTWGVELWTADGATDSSGTPYLFQSIPRSERKWLWLNASGFDQDTGDVVDIYMTFAPR